MSSTQIIVVVGVAIVLDGRVLAVRRTYPPALAGRWELPGGKVEPGEDPAVTAVREVREELGCEVEVTGWLEPTSPIDDQHVLRIAYARLVSGSPQPTEHDQARWLAPDQLHAYDWLAPDLPLLPEIARHLASTAQHRATP